MLTGRTDVADRVAAFEAGADDYVVKPVRVTELVERVKRRLHQSRGGLAGRLMGSPELYAELSRRMDAGEPTAAIYVEVNGLRAFSRCYSFTRAERLLEWLGELLLLEAADHPPALAGRLGADDFLLLAPPGVGVAMAEDLVGRFADGVASFYDRRDAARGWIEVIDRAGLARRFRLMSLSVGIATTPTGRAGHHLEVMERAAEMARYAGTGSGGSRVAVDRRS
jgi:GGDEF domain-containing protein